MNDPHRIVALRGASNHAIQSSMMAAVRRWTGQGARIVGVLEATDGPENAPLTAARLVNLTDGTAYPIFQDLGPFSTACHLDSVGIVAACAAVRQDILCGCDLVVLSKFGKLEAERSGLIDAFAAAIEQDKPILTAVAPLFKAEWEAFSAPLATVMKPEPELLDQWWREVFREV